MILSSTLLRRLAALFLGCLAALAVVYAAHGGHFAGRGVLFWDEWIYLREIQAGPGCPWWAFTPTSAHLFVPAKLLFCAAYTASGTGHAPYEAVTLTLHVATGLALFRLLRGPAGPTAAYAASAAFLVSPAYEEVLSWTNHHREQCFVLLFVLWTATWEGAGSVVVTRPRRAASGVLLLLLCVSYGNVLFGAAAGAAALASFGRRFAASGLLLPNLAALAAAGGVYVAARPALSAQLAAQSPEAASFTAAKATRAAADVVTFWTRGVAAPLAGVPPDGPAAETAAVLLAGVLVAASVLRLVRRGRDVTALSPLDLGLWYGGAAAALVALQCWYRPDVRFLLDWTKYSYFPVALLFASLPLLAAGVAGRRAAAVPALCLASLAAYSAASGPRRTYDGLTKNAGVRELLDDFARSFGPGADGGAPGSSDGPVLFDLPFERDVFIPGSGPTLSLLWAADPRLRGSSPRWAPLPPSPDADPACRLARADPAVGGFYDRYRPYASAPAAGDAGVSPPLRSDTYLSQELVFPDRQGYLHALDVVLGTGGGGNASPVEVRVTDDGAKVLTVTTRPASTFSDNVPTRLPLGGGLPVPRRVWISLRAGETRTGGPVSVYLAAPGAVHRGRTVACGRSDLPPASCPPFETGGARPAVGIGAAWSPLPAFTSGETSSASPSGCRP